MAEAQVHKTHNCNGCSTIISKDDYYSCRDCNKELCDRSGCLDHHRKMEHDVFHITSSGEYKVDERVSGICERHPRKPTDSYCQNCKEAVCIRCNTLHHNGHDIVDTTDVLADKRRLIERDTLKLTYGPLQALDTVVSSFSDEIDTTERNYEGLEKAVDEFKSKWMAEVNSVSKTLKASLVEMKDRHIWDLKSQKTSLEIQRSSIYERISDNKSLLRECNSEMLRYESDIDELLSLPSLNKRGLPSFRTGNIEKAHSRLDTLGNLKYTPDLTLSRTEILAKSCLCFAELLSPPETLPSHQIKANSHIVPTIRCSAKNKFKNAKDMSCTKSSDAWIYDAKEESIAKFGEKEIKITMFTNIKTEFIAGISETEVIYSDNTDNTIKSLSVNGKCILFSTGEWNPFGLAIAKDGRILVCQQNIGIGKVSTYLRNGEMLRDLKEEKDRILYKKPYRVAENINGDVCTIDLESPIAVVIVSRLGKFKARYECVNWNSFRIFSSPQPTSICTDSYGNIVVCDGSKIHLLDIAGDFMQYIDVLVSSPSLISVDEQDFLWVIEKQQSVKIIEYLKNNLLGVESAQ